jgi:hypothetical protein
MGATYPHPQHIMFVNHLLYVCVGVYIVQTVP